MSLALAQALQKNAIRAGKLDGSHSRHRIDLKELGVPGRKCHPGLPAPKHSV